MLACEQRALSLYWKLVRLPAVLLLLASALSARVILVSLDGLGNQAFLEDPAAAELSVLREVARRGVRADGVTPHFPSTTSNSHAALFTGAWGDVNGIIGNSSPVAPRADHTAFERVNGFRSDNLRAEPLWVSAARQGVKAVALEVPQAYPFHAVNTGGSLKIPPVVVNGYQTRLISPHRVIRMGDVQAEACGGSSGGAKCFHWMAGPVVLHGRLQGDRSMAIWADGGSGTVIARAAPLESEPPRRREMARNFSDGIFLARVPGSSPAVVYFRLFDAARDGSDFLLYQSPIHELAIYDPPESGNAVAARLLREAGGFVGNGPGHDAMQAPFLFGAPLWKGGDGTAERRYLEVCELVARQAIRQAQWFLEHDAPELFVGYLPFPDEMEHNWKGAPAVNSRYEEFRAWGYAIVNRVAAFYADTAKPQDDVVFVSDHGMAAVTHEVAINAALREAELLAVDDRGRIEPEGTAAVHLRNCVIVNTTDWKGGIVPLSERALVLTRVVKALRSIRDPVSGQAVITRIYDTAGDAARFGFGGPNGADVCFDYLPGYEGSDGTQAPVVRRLEAPAGQHGFDPTRADMRAILIGAGPKLPRGKVWPMVRSIDVAALVSDLLGIEAPRESRGTSPLR